jgi:hypothetical protein
MKRLPVLGAVLALTISGAAAQVDSVAIADELNAAWENAQANASRPGDEALTCDQLQTELDAAQSDPAIRERLAALDGQAQEAMRLHEKAKTLGLAMGVGRAALGVAVAGQQGADMINLFAAYLQIGIMTLQANAAAPLAAAMKANVLAMMPHHGRTMRVVLLADGKGCAFMRPAQP